LFHEDDLPWLVPSNVHAVCQPCQFHGQPEKMANFQRFVAMRRLFPWPGLGRGVINCSTVVQYWSSTAGTLVSDNARTAFCAFPMPTTAAPVPPMRQPLSDSERSSVEHRLSQSERDMRSVLDNMPAMIGYWDSHLRNRFGNHAYFTWFGIDPARMPGMHIRDVIGEERYRLNLPYIEAALRGEEQVFERAIPVPGEPSRLRQSLARYIPDIVDGVVQGFYVLVSDITPIKEIEAAYLASEARYRAVLMDQTELISRFDQDGRFIFVNEAYCRFFARTEAELLGQRWQPAVLPADLPIIKARMAGMTPEDPVVTIEHRVYSGNGELRWMQLVNRGFFDAVGNLREVQSIGRDITARKNAEEALQQAHDALEQRVVERTEELRSLAIEATLSEERERLGIARDLHDELGQLLHIAKFKLDTLARAVPADCQAQVGELNSLLADASRQVRSLTSQLSPQVLRNLGLSAALRWLGEEMGRLYGLAVDCRGADLAQTCQLSEVQQTILFRAARELLINVHKHAGTSAASLVMAYADDVVSIEVADCGVGMASAADALCRNDTFGLLSIRERILYLGGSTEITTAPGRGMRVVIRMPVGEPVVTSKGR
jgi:PAS domain S-box-containing protein